MTPEGRARLEKYGSTVDTANVAIICQRIADYPEILAAAAEVLATPQGTADGPDVAALTEAEREELGDWYDSLDDRDWGLPGLYVAVGRILADRLAAVTAQRDQYAAQVARVEAALRHNDDEIRDGHGANRAGRRAFGDDLRAALRADGGGGE